MNGDPEAARPARAYFSNTSTVKLPGTIAPRGLGFWAVGAGGGPKAAAERNRRWVRRSRARVLARGWVAMVVTGVYLSGPSWWMMARLPSPPPHELKMLPVAGSKAVASTPGPMGTVAITLP